MLFVETCCGSCNVNFCAMCRQPSGELSVELCSLQLLPLIERTCLAHMPSSEDALSHSTWSSLSNEVRGHHFLDQAWAFQ